VHALKRVSGLISGVACQRAVNSAQRNGINIAHSSELSPAIIDEQKVRSDLCHLLFRQISDQPVLVQYEADSFSLREKVSSIPTYDVH